MPHYNATYTYWSLGKTIKNANPIKNIFKKSVKRSLEVCNLAYNSLMPQHPVAVYLERKTMKAKKITRNELKQGMLIALTSHADATVYILGNQHEDTGFVWQLMRHERGMITSCGWSDYSSFLYPTKKQLNSIYNAPMIARYQATLTETI